MRQYCGRCSRYHEVSDEVFTSLIERYGDCVCHLHEICELCNAICETVHG